MPFDQTNRHALHSSIVATLLGLAVVTFAGCAGQTDSSASQSQSESISAGDGGAAVASSCLTTYVDCVRADNGDPRACRDALRACMPPPPHPGGPDHCDDDGGMQRPPLPPPPPPPPRDGDAAPPPPPPPPPDGPRKCLDALDACAVGMDPVATCVDDALACFAAAPPPPPPPPPPR
jgi:hypothetical protein